MPETPSTTSLEIQPGRSIGPFALGMSRDDVEALNFAPMEPFTDGSGAELTELGIKLHYDESGRCRRIEARVLGTGTAQFVLAGHKMNDITDIEARAIFAALAGEVENFYGGFEIPSIGIWAVKWERTDDVMFAIGVEPPRQGRR
jgi:hypothetical protein